MPAGRLADNPNSGSCAVQSGAAETRPGTSSGNGVQLPSPAPRSLKTATGDSIASSGGEESGEPHKPGPSLERQILSFLNSKREPARSLAVVNHFLARGFSAGETMGTLSRLVASGRAKVEAPGLWEAL